MHYAYLDESGSVEPFQETDYFLVVAVVVGNRKTSISLDRLVRRARKSLGRRKKAELKAENFKDQGPEGIIAWGNAVYSALIEHEAEIRANELLNERWETFQQEHMAETDGDRPPMVRGRKVAGTLPDLIATDTTVLFEDAFTRKAQEKE